MKKVCFYFFLLLGMIAIESNAQDSLKYAEITFDKEVFDFDSIPYEGNGTVYFGFTNAGDDTLRISFAKGSCGCTVPSYPQNKPFLPGESDSIKVTYDTKRQGAFVKKVYVYTNSKTEKKELTIKGYVKAKPPAFTFPLGDQQRSGMIPVENK